MSYLYWHEKIDRFILEECDRFYHLRVYTSGPVVFDDGTQSTRYRNWRIGYYPKDSFSYDQAVAEAKKKKDEFTRINSPDRFTVI